MSAPPPPYPGDNKQYPQQAGYPQQQYPQPTYVQPTAYVYQQPTHMQYTTAYPQAVYTTQPQTVIVDDCHHHHRRGEAERTANLCCLFAGLACLCALCAR